MKGAIKLDDNRLNELLAARGFRSTQQREHVYNVLLQERDHPTAEQVFMRAKKRIPDISIATVYNCLDALVKSGLVREVKVDRSAMRYCPNMSQHCHFYCEHCGGVFDIDYGALEPQPNFHMPRGFQATACDISFRGACPKCGGAKKG